LPSPVTAKSISEFRFAKELPVGLPSMNCVTYKYNGKLLYYVDPSSSEDVRLSAQLAIFAVGNAVTASTTYGKLQVRGVIDFYGPNNVTSPPSLTQDMKQRWIDMRSGTQRLVPIESLKNYNSKIRIEALEEKFLLMCRNWRKLGDPSPGVQDVNVVGGNVTISPGTSALLVTAGTTALLTALSGTPTVNLASGLFPLPITVSSSSTTAQSVTGSVTAKMYGMNGTNSVPISCNSSGIVYSSGYASNISNGVLTSISCDSNGHLLNNTFDGIGNSIGSFQGNLNSQLFTIYGTNSENVKSIAGVLGSQIYASSGGSPVTLSCGSTGILNSNVYGINSGSYVNVSVSSSGSVSTNAVISASSGIQSLIDCGTSGMLPLKGYVANYGSGGTQAFAVTSATFQDDSGNTQQLMKGQVLTLNDGKSSPENFVKTTPYCPAYNAGTSSSVVEQISSTYTSPGLGPNPVVASLASLDKEAKEQKPDNEVTRLKKLMRLKQLQKELDLEDSVFIVNPNYIEQKVK